MAERRLTLEEYLALLRCFPHGGGQYLRSRTKPDMAVSFLPAAEAGDTLLELDDAISYSISGNNMDGFILTMGRQ